VPACRSTQFLAFGVRQFAPSYYLVDMLANRLDGGAVPSQTLDAAMMPGQPLAAAPLEGGGDQAASTDQQPGRRRRRLRQQQDAGAGAQPPAPAPPLAKASWLARGDPDPFWRELSAAVTAVPGAPTDPLAILTQPPEAGPLAAACPVRCHVARCPSRSVSTVPREPPALGYLMRASGQQSCGCAGR
jgi:hypothetical protein